MATELINHLRIPGGVPKAEGLEYFEQVDATFGPYGGSWLVLGAPDEEWLQQATPAIQHLSSLA